MRVVVSQWRWFNMLAFYVIMTVCLPNATWHSDRSHSSNVSLRRWTCHRTLLLFLIHACRISASLPRHYLRVTIVMPTVWMMRAIIIVIVLIVLIIILIFKIVTYQWRKKMKHLWHRWNATSKKKQILLHKLMLMLMLAILLIIVTHNQSNRNTHNVHLIN